VKLGELAPPFQLEATDGSHHESHEELPVAVVFTCNHCPYALAWHDRLLDVASDYAGRARVLLINSNDAERYPRDSFDAMIERVEADGGWPAPYLWDDFQEIARAWDAKTTPDVFVLDREGDLRYRGAPDVDHGDPSQNAAWLRGALEAVLAGREPDPAETEPVGCSIKWRQ
jgi:hypothetical protein